MYSNLCLKIELSETETTKIYDCIRIIEDIQDLLTKSGMESVKEDCAKLNNGKEVLYKVLRGKYFE